MSEGIIVRQILQQPQFSEVLRFSAGAFEKSNYAPIKFNSVIARNTLKATLKDRSMRPFTAWRGQTCVGLLIGMIAPLPWSAGLSATDLVFVAEQGGDMLLERFVKWARENRCVRIDMGVSDDGARPAMDRFYEAGGLKKAGRVYFWQREIEA